MKKTNNLQIAGPTATTSHVPSEVEPRGDGKVYVDDGKNRIVGEVRLVRGWNPIGHPVRLILTMKYEIFFH